MTKKQTIIGQIRPLSPKEKADTLISLVNITDVEDKEKKRIPNLMSVGEHYLSGTSWTVLPQLISGERLNLIEPKIIERRLQLSVEE